MDLLDLSFIAISMLLIFLVIASTWFDYRLNKNQKSDHYQLEIPCRSRCSLLGFVIYDPN